ncbi:BON domain-containing protein [Oxalobacter vibrioformis]|uniref:Osmotically-inducible protein Y n=1 Tax=Oxalobacter vibrioformis TaxID=933080 RepID=A0A9E9LTI7_9BURK|nr:BON domain-containing protein [Oxalobacter vibrioformis]WAW09365.1 BON domain-containing protein [Oxalobacter vibrioformis]
MKTLRQFSAFVMTFLFVSVLACAAGQSQAKETAAQYVDDTAITTEVKTRIFAQKDLSAAEINVETYKGTVQLSGFVSNPAQIKKAEDVAKSVKGVKNVDNSIKLKN